MRPVSNWLCLFRLCVKHTAQKAMRSTAFLNSGGTCSANIIMAENNRHPPTSGALKQHIIRVHIQASVWGRASIAQHEFLDPLQNEFCKDANGDLVPHTTDYLPTPKAIIEMVNCHCKGNCSSQTCGCRSHNLACTERCLCSTKCQNDDDYNCNPLSDESTDCMMTYGRYDLKLLKK